MAATDAVIHSGTAPDATLASDITNASTTVTLTSGTGYPSPTGGQIAYITIAKGTSAEELVSYSGRSGASLTGCSRGLGGTSAASHLAGVSIYHGWTAVEADDAMKATLNTIGKVTTAGDVLVGTAANVMKRLAIGAAYKALGVNAGATDLTYLDTMASLLTAQGDLPYASAANTPARLAKGAALKALQMNQAATAPQWASGYPLFVFADATARDAAITAPVEGLFAWLTGTDVLTYYTGSAWANYGTTGIIASLEYTGGTGSYSLTSATLTAVDTTNLRLTFTAPASGNVMVTLMGPTDISTVAGWVNFGILEGASTIGSARTVHYEPTLLNNLVINSKALIKVTGLVAGSSHTYDFAWACGGGCTASMSKGAPNGMTMMVEALP